jgi:phytoene dehydrogenase-like protein
MDKKKALIVGGGIAGLCAGVYLQKNGFDSEILEMHTVPGGLATAWTRQGYTFENCVHWLVGSKPGTGLNSMWTEVLDIGRLRFHDDEVYQRIEKGGRALTVYKDIDRMEREFLEHAPEDAAAIREFTRLLRKLSRIRIPGDESGLLRLASYAAALPSLPALRRYSKVTMGEFTKRFKNPLLREFFGGAFGNLSLLALAFSLAWMAAGDAAYPIGGSPPLIRLIAERYAALGGRIRYGARVRSIAVEEGRAVGVVLASGERVPAGLVVSAADGHATIFEMLGEEYASDRIRKIYATYQRFPSYIQVSLGVAADLAGEPGFLSLALDREIEIDPQTRTSTLSLRVFNFDPTFAPPGKTAVVAFLPTWDDVYWQSLRERNLTRYAAEKGRIAADVIAAVARRFPAAAGHIEVVDVATPATVIRYTGNWHGSMEGWLMTPATGIRPLPCVLPGLKGFYMVGQWISPGGGLPSGLMTARAVSRKICRDHGLSWNPKGSTGVLKEVG